MIGARIAEERVLRGWTQGQLAAQLKVEDSTVSRWESEESFPRGASLKRLAELFEIEVAALFSPSAPKKGTDGEESQQPGGDAADTSAVGEREGVAKAAV